MRSPRLLSLKEMLLLVAILTIFAFLALVIFGNRVGTTITYITIVVVTLLALINKNTSLKDKIFHKKLDPVN